METFLRWIAGPAVQDWYLGFATGVLVLPILLIALWYHRNIGATPGGRALMERQGQLNQLPDLGGFAAGAELHRDITSGRYGAMAKSMQARLYLLVGCWLIANTVVFGLLIWAQEVVKTPLSP